MTEADFHWLIGMIEGEGCFSHTEFKGNQRIVFRIGSIDKDVIERIARLIGSSIYSTKTQTQKELYVASASGKKAVTLALIIYPHMSKRRQSQIQECLKLRHDLHEFAQYLINNR